MGPAKRSVRFASLLACAVWDVSLAGFYESEHAGLHIIEDSRKIVLSDTDANVETVRQAVPESDTQTHAVVPAFSLLDDSSIPSPSLPVMLRYGIDRSPTAVDQLIATTVLRPQPGPHNRGSFLSSRSEQILSSGGRNASAGSRWLER